MNIPIETLWVIPIIAFGISIPVIIYSIHESNTEYGDESNKEKLAHEVDEFNRSGVTHEKSVHSENRLNEIENTIRLVSSALSNQQQIIESVKGKDSSVTNELKSLNRKLYDLQKEYDILLSENYSMRARLNQLLNNNEKSTPANNYSFFSEAIQSSPPKKTPGKLDTGKLYEDTRSFKTSELNDTSEINLSDLN